MGQFFVDGEVVKIAFEDGEWIDVKEELSQADQDYLLDQMAKAESIGKDAKISFSLGRLAMLERSIITWSFQIDGKPVPVTKDNISRLRLKYRQKVLEEVNRLNEQAGEFTRKNSLTAST